MEGQDLPRGTFQKHNHFALCLLLSFDSLLADDTYLYMPFNKSDFCDILWLLQRINGHSGSDGERFVKDYKEAIQIKLLTNAEKKVDSSQWTLVIIGHFETDLIIPPFADVFFLKCESLNHTINKHSTQVAHQSFYKNTFLFLNWAMHF